MPKPKRVGRPKLAKGEAKGHVVVVRLHAEDYKAVNAAAKATGKKLSEFVRDSLKASANG